MLSRTGTTNYSVNISITRGRGPILAFKIETVKIPVLLKEKFKKIEFIIGQRMEDPCLSNKISSFIPKLEKALRDLVRSPQKFRSLNAPDLPLSDTSDNGMFGKYLHTGELVEMHFLNGKPTLMILTYKKGNYSDPSKVFGTMTDYYLYEG